MSTFVERLPIDKNVNQTDDREESKNGKCSLQHIPFAQLLPLVLELVLIGSPVKLWRTALETKPFFNQRC